MAIAIIGWGSLICSPGSFSLASRWHRDGPSLPLEFARVSGGNRLTLVISDGSPVLQTYWALASSDDMSTVIADVRLREGSTRIHSAVRDRVQNSETIPVVAANMIEWLAQHPDLTGCVWTGLTSNWLEKRGRVFSEEDALDYLTGLPDQTAAKQYIENAPMQIQTPLRRIIRDRLGWVDAVLPQNLFAND